MSHNIQYTYKNKNIKLPLTSRGANAHLNQRSHLNKLPSTHNNIIEISSDAQIGQSNPNEEVITQGQGTQNQELVESSNQNKEETKTNTQNVELEKDDFKIKQIKVVTNKNRGIGLSSINSNRENHSNISVPSIMNKANDHKNISRNEHKNIKFNPNIEISKDRKQSNIRSKLLEDSNKKNHTRAKSYFTERKFISNYLPQQIEVKSRLSHSVEIKRKTIVRGDKYNNIQITHIISVSKPNLSKYNFHIFEKLSTNELNTKPLDLTKIKLYIKKDPNAKSFYNTSCRNVPLKSAEKILKTVHYQHAGGRGMTNLKSSNLNAKFYQSGIERIPIKEIKRAPIVKIINEFRSQGPETNRSLSFGNKYTNNYNFNKKTYDASLTQRGKNQINQEKENIKNRNQQHKNKENEEKNKFSKINYNNQTIKTNIVPLSSRGNVYNSKTYTNTRYNNINTYKPKEVPNKETRKNIVVNTNTRPIKNIYTNNQYQKSKETVNSNNIISPRQNINQNIKTDINKTEIEKKPTEEIDTKKEIINEIPSKTELDNKEEKVNIETQKPKYINKLPLTSNINRDNNQNNLKKDNIISPRTIGLNQTNNNEKINSQNINKIETRTYTNKTNNSNILPTSNTRNVNVHTNKIVTNRNINQPIISHKYINNRPDNKYQNTNNTKVIPSSRRPVITQNRPVIQPKLDNNINTSNKEHEIKTQKTEIKAIKDNNEEKNKIIPETEKNTINNNISSAKQIQTQTVNYSNMPKKYKNSDVKITSKPLEKNIKITIPINSKVQLNPSPLTSNKNIKEQEKPKNVSITYTRPSKTMTNVTHYVNKTSSDISTINKPEQLFHVTTNQTEPKKTNTNIQRNNISKVTISQNRPKFKNEYRSNIQPRTTNKKTETNISHVQIKKPEIQKQEISQDKNKEKKEELNVLENKPEEENKKAEEKIIHEEKIKIDNKEEKPLTEEIKEDKKEEPIKEVEKIEIKETEKKEEKLIDKIEEKKEELNLEQIEEKKEDKPEEIKSDNLNEIKEEKPEIKEETKEEVKEELKENDIKLEEIKEPIIEEIKGDNIVEKKSENKEDNIT